jgi:hypothetical protein
MPTATQPPTTPTRRSALGFSAAALLSGLMAPVLASPADPDAELIALCAEFDRQNEIVETVPIASEADFGGFEVAMDKRWKVSNEIEDIVPLTGAGLKAKAEIALALLEENYGPDGGQEGAALRFATSSASPNGASGGVTRPVWDLYKSNWVSDIGSANNAARKAFQAAHDVPRKCGPNRSGRSIASRIVGAWGGTASISSPPGSLAPRERPKHRARSPWRPSRSAG